MTTLVNSSQLGGYKKPKSKTSKTSKTSKSARSKTSKRKVSSKSKSKIDGGRSTLNNVLRSEQKRFKYDVNKELANRGIKPSMSFYKRNFTKDGRQLMRDYNETRLKNNQKPKINFLQKYFFDNNGRNKEMMRSYKDIRENQVNDAINQQHKPAHIQQTSVPFAQPFAQPSVPSAINSIYKTYQNYPMYPPLKPYLPS